MCYLGKELKLSYIVYLKTIFKMMINMSHLYSLIHDQPHYVLECCYIRLAFQIITYMYFVFLNSIPCNTAVTFVYHL